MNLCYLLMEYKAANRLNSEILYVMALPRLICNSSSELHVVGVTGICS